MSDQPASISQPPATVAQTLRVLGYSPVQLPGGVVWWRSPGGAVASWEESVQGLLAELDQRRKLATSGAGKHFLKTSEFWMAAATLLGLGGGAISILAGWGLTLGEPWKEMVGGAMALATVLVPRAYTFARAKAKAIEAAEQQAMAGGSNGP